MNKGLTDQQFSGKILLSFDVEEFDLPLEYDRAININEQLQTGYKGLQQINEVLDTPYVCSTLFTTALFAMRYPVDITRLSERHEIASHTYYHGIFAVNDLKYSKEKLEAVTGKPVYGLRMPRMKKINPAYIKDAGYQYNSSINPTWIPGRYNNLNMPRTLFMENGLLQFPVSVTPNLRIPLFWLAFKNMPYYIFLKLVLQTLRHDGYVSLYFHPWEFTDLSAYKLPGYIKRGSNEKLLAALKRLLTHLSGEGEFMLMHDFIKSRSAE